MDRFEIATRIATSLVTVQPPLSEERLIEQSFLLADMLIAKYQADKVVNEDEPKEIHLSDLTARDVRASPDFKLADRISAVKTVRYLTGCNLGAAVAWCRKHHKFLGFDENVF